MNNTNTSPALPAFTVAPTSMRGQSLLQWHETPGAAGLRSLQMPTHIAKAFAATPALLAALKDLEWAHSRLLSSESGGVGPEDDEKIIHAGEIARAAIALAEGRA